MRKKCLTNRIIAVTLCAVITLGNIPAIQADAEEYTEAYTEPDVQEQEAVQQTQAVEPAAEGVAQASVDAESQPAPAAETTPVETAAPEPETIPQTEPAVQTTEPQTTAAEPETVQQTSAAETESQAVTEAAGQTEETGATEGMPETEPGQSEGTESETETESESETESETETETEKVSEPAELVQNFVDSNGNVVQSVKANIPEGAFDAKASELSMEVNYLDQAGEEYIKGLMKETLESNHYLGNYVLFDIIFKVNGQVAEPKKEITITFEGNGIDIRDTKKATVFFIEKADPAVPGDTNKVKEITQRDEMVRLLQEAGQSTEHIDDYDLADIFLKADGTADKIQMEGRTSTIYGCYVSKLSEAVTFTQEVDGVIVRLDAPEGAFPVDSDQVVMTARNATEEQREKVRQLLEQKAEENNEELVNYIVYDISLSCNGEEIQPQVPVQVTYENSGLMQYEESAVGTYRVDENSEQLEEVSGSVDEYGNVSLEAPHFTLYPAGETVPKATGSQVEEGVAQAAVAALDAVPEIPGVNNEWQVVSGLYEGNTADKKDISTDGNVRIQKNIVPTGVENEFLVYLSMDKKATWKEFLGKNTIRLTDGRYTTSQIYAGTNSGYSYTVKVNVKNGSNVLFTYQENRYGTKADFGVNSKIRAYLDLNGDNSILLDSQISFSNTGSYWQPKYSVTINFDVSNTKASFANDDVKFNSVTDKLGENIIYSDVVSSDGSAGYNAGTKTLTWTPVADSSVTAEVINDSSAGWTGWYNNVCQLVYKVKLDVTADGFNSCASTMDTAEGNTVYPISSEAGLVYSYSNTAGTSQSMSFAPAAVRGLLYDYEFTVTKDDDIPLADAVFKLTGSEIDQITGNPAEWAAGSDEGGIVKFTNLPAGVYTLSQTDIPDGYYGIADSELILRYTEGGFQPHTSDNCIDGVDNNGANMVNEDAHSLTLINRKEETRKVTVKNLVNGIDDGDTLPSDIFTITLESKDKVFVKDEVSETQELLKQDFKLKHGEAGSIDVFAQPGGTIQVSEKPASGYCIHKVTCRLGEKGIEKDITKSLTVPAAYTGANEELIITVYNKEVPSIQMAAVITNYDSSMQNETFTVNMTWGGGHEERINLNPLGTILPTDESLVAGAKGIVDTGVKVTDENGTTFHIEETGLGSGYLFSYLEVVDLTPDSVKNKEGYRAPERINDGGYAVTVYPENTVTIVVKNRKIKQEIVINNDPQPDYSKSIEQSDEDPELYDLHLDVSGNGWPHNADIVLVVDISNSMDWGIKTTSAPTDGSLTRMELLKKAAAQFVDSLVPEAGGNQMSIVTFGSGYSVGRTDAYSGKYDTRVKIGATDNHDLLINAVDSLYSAQKDPTINNNQLGGTNYEAAAYMISEALATFNSKDPARRKYVVFVSDGKPTYRLSGNNNNSVESDRDGSAASTNEMSEALDAIGQLQNLDAFFGIGVSSDSLTQEYNRKSFFNQFVSGTSAGGWGMYSALDDDGIDKALKEISYYITRQVGGIVIQDTLTDDVEIIDSNGDGKIDSRDVTITKRKKGADYKEAVTLDAALINSVEISGKTVTVKLDPEYLLDSGYTYDVKFRVRVTESAKEKYIRQNGYGGIVGDSGTNFNPDKPTSAGQPGFYSNTKATLQYRYGIHEVGEEYLKPVVQLKTPEPVKVAKVVRGYTSESAEDLFDVSFTQVTEKNGNYTEVQGGTKKAVSLKALGGPNTSRNTLLNGASEIKDLVMLNNQDAVIYRLDETPGDQKYILEGFELINLNSRAEQNRPSYRKPVLLQAADGNWYLKIYRENNVLVKVTNALNSTVRIQKIVDGTMTDPNQKFIINADSSSGSTQVVLGNGETSGDISFNKEVFLNISETVPQEYIQTGITAVAANGSAVSKDGNGNFIIPLGSDITITVRNQTADKPYFGGSTDKNNAFTAAGVNGTNSGGTSGGTGTGGKDSSTDSAAGGNTSAGGNGTTSGSGSTNTGGNSGGGTGSGNGEGSGSGGGSGSLPTDQMPQNQPSDVNGQDSGSETGGQTGTQGTTGGQGTSENHGTSGSQDTSAGSVGSTTKTSKLNTDKTSGTGYGKSYGGGLGYGSSSRIGSYGLKDSKEEQPVDVVLVIDLKEGLTDEKLENGLGADETFRKMIADYLNAFIETQNQDTRLAVAELADQMYQRRELTEIKGLDEKGIDKLVDSLLLTGNTVLENGEKLTADAVASRILKGADAAESGHQKAAVLLTGNIKQIKMLDKEGNEIGPDTQENPVRNLYTLFKEIAVSDEFKAAAANNEDGSVSFNWNNGTEEQVLTFKFYLLAGESEKVLQAEPEAANK